MDNLFETAIEEFTFKFLCNFVKTVKPEEHAPKEDFISLCVRAHKDDLLASVTTESYATQFRLAPKECYQMNEFLGDAMLSSHFKQYIMKHNKHFAKLENMFSAESVITRINSYYLSKLSLYRASRYIKLDRHIRMGTTEKQQPASICEDVFEAWTYATSLCIPGLVDHFYIYLFDLCFGYMLKNHPFICNQERSTINNMALSKNLSIKMEVPELPPDSSYSVIVKLLNANHCLIFGVEECGETQEDVNMKILKSFCLQFVIHFGFEAFIKAYYTNADTMRWYTFFSHLSDEELLNGYLSIRNNPDISLVSSTFDTLLIYNLEPNGEYIRDSGFKPMSHVSQMHEYVLTRLDLLRCPKLLAATIEKDKACRLMSLSLPPNYIVIDNKQRKRAPTSEDSTPKIKMVKKE